MRTLRVLILAALVPIFAFGQESLGFPALDQWKDAVVSGDPARVAALYSSVPPAQINTGKGNVDAAAEAAFWAGLRVHSMTISVVQATAPQPGVQKVLFQAKARTPARTVYVTAAQIWQMQSGGWRIVAAQRDIAKLEQPLSVTNKIYPAQGSAREEIRAAQKRALKAHKRVLVVFGADWCYDCHVLDKAFHRPDIAAVLVPNYEVVHVDVGQGDQNQDLMEEYGVPMKRGIPAVAILDAGGKVLYRQRNGEWERARALGPEDLIALLRKWKPQA